MSAGELFPYCDRDPASGGLDLMPDLPIVLRLRDQATNRHEFTVIWPATLLRCPRVVANPPLLVVTPESEPVELALGSDARRPGPRCECDQRIRAAMSRA